MRSAGLRTGSARKIGLTVETATGPGPGTPGPERSIWPSPSCGRVATSPTGCSSLAGARSERSSRWSASPTSEACRRGGSRAWCGSSGSSGSPRAGSPRWPRSSIIRSRPSGRVRSTVVRTARAGGKRRYGDEVLERLSILGVAKQAGFSLDEIRVLFEATDGGAPAHTQLKELARRKLPEVEALIAHAREVKTWLEATDPLHLRHPERMLAVRSWARRSVRRMTVPVPSGTALLLKPC